MPHCQKAEGLWVLWPWEFYLSCNKIHIGGKECQMPELTQRGICTKFVWVPGHLQLFRCLLSITCPRWSSLIRGASCCCCGLLRRKSFSSTLWGNTEFPYFGNYLANLTKDRLGREKKFTQYVLSTYRRAHRKCTSKRHLAFETYIPS